MFFFDSRYQHSSFITREKGNSDPIKSMKRTRVRLNRNVAPCSRPTTNVIGPLHECKKVCPCTKALPQSGTNQARSEEKEKERKRYMKERGHKADGK